MLKAFSTTINENHEKHFKYLAQLLKFNSIEQFTSKLTLLYRASENSFSAKKFHELCDDKGPTLTIVRSVSKSIYFWKSERLFGGYASKSWFSGDKAVSSPDSFLFSLDSQTKHEIYQKEAYAIRGYDFWGPKFGDGADLAISNNCNSNTRSYSYLGSTYSLPDGIVPESQKAKQYFAGSDEFQVNEYEVYKVTG